MPHRWYFFHIPKTAGTTLIHILADAARLCPASDWPTLVNLPDRRLHRYDGFAGHFGSALSDYLHEPLRTATFLRHPFDHVLSAWSHLLRDPTHRLHAQANAMTFARFLRQFAIMRNPQTRWLARDLITTDFRSHPEAVDREIARAIAASESENEHSPQTLLDRATARLQSFEFVGLVENYEHDITRLFAKLSFPLRHPIPTLNRASRAINWNSLTTEEQSLLEQGLQLDLALYDQAKKLAPQP